MSGVSGERAGGCAAGSRRGGAQQGQGDHRPAGQPTHEAERHGDSVELRSIRHKQAAERNLMEAPRRDNPSSKTFISDVESAQIIRSTGYGLDRPA